MAQEVTTPSAPVATFKAVVTLVPISLVVRDRRGHAVTKLNPTDFEVFDNGVPTKIVSFGVAHEASVSVAVLLDTSGSMRMGPRLTLADDVFRRLLAELRDGRDDVGFFTFDAGLHEVGAFTEHPATLGSGPNGITPFGTTSLYDAIAAAARALAERPASRRAVVVLTDGLDTSSALTPEQVSAVAGAIDVPVFVIETITPTDRDAYTRRPGGSSPQLSELGELAQWTGGDLLFATSAEDALVTARYVLGTLRYSYLLAIAPAAQPGWRRIEVRVRNRSLRVEARGGYFGR